MMIYFKTFERSDENISMKRYDFYKYHKNYIVEEKGFVKQKSKINKSILSYLIISGISGCLLLVSALLISSFIFVFIIPVIPMIILSIYEGIKPKPVCEKQIYYSEINKELGGGFIIGA